MTAQATFPLPQADSASGYWFTPHECVYEDEAVRLLKFSKGVGNVLIIPPQAGHHSYIADYDDGQSLVQAAVSESKKSVYAVEWKSCTLARAHEGIEALLDQLDRCVKVIRGRVHLIGLCQGGWLSTIYTVLHPTKVQSLTIAGSPIDTHAAPSSLDKYVQMPMAMFDSLVFWGGGLMRGDMMLMGWKSSNPYKHYVERYTNTCDKTRKFYAWYDLTQDLAGRWYLWTIENFFKKNRLGRNELHIGTRHVDLEKIQCPVHVIAGSKDDITPPAQSLALLRYVKGKTSTHEIDAGHIGVFMSGRGIRDVWQPFFATL